MHPKCCCITCMSTDLYMHFVFCSLSRQILTHISHLPLKGQIMTIIAYLALLWKYRRWDIFNFNTSFLDKSHLAEISTNKLDVFVMWSHWNILTHLSHTPPQILKLLLLPQLLLIPLLLPLLKLLHPPPLAPVLHYHQLHNQPLYLPTTQKVAMHRSSGMGCSQSVVTVVTSNLVNTN